MQQQYWLKLVTINQYVHNSMRVRCIGLLCFLDVPCGPWTLIGDDSIPNHHRQAYLSYCLLLVSFKVYLIDIYTSTGSKLLLNGCISVFLLTLGNISLIWLTIESVFFFYIVEYNFFQCIRNYDKNKSCILFLHFQRVSSFVNFL